MKTLDIKSLTSHPRAVHSNIVYNDDSVILNININLDDIDIYSKDVDSILKGNDYYDEQIDDNYILHIILR